VNASVLDPRPLLPISRWEVCDDLERVWRNDLIRIALVPVGVDWRLNNLVSYRSEIAMYDPSSEIADEIRLVRS
jgi:hypothetical protein